MTEETYTKAVKLWNKMDDLQAQIDITKKATGVSIYGDIGRTEIPIAWVKNIVLNKLEQELNNPKEEFREL